MAKRIVLANYISSLWGNWETIKSSYNTSGNGKNKAKTNDITVERQARDLKNIDDIDN